MPLVAQLNFLTVVQHIVEELFHLERVRLESREIARHGLEALVRLGLDVGGLLLGAAHESDAPQHGRDRQSDCQNSPSHDQILRLSVGATPPRHPETRRAHEAVALPEVVLSLVECVLKPVFRCHNPKPLSGKDNKLFPWASRSLRCSSLWGQFPSEEYAASGKMVRLRTFCDNQRGMPVVAVAELCRSSKPHTAAVPSLGE